MGNCSTEYYDELRAERQRKEELNKLLEIDLCGRLPYSPKVNYKDMLYNVLGIVNGRVILALPFYSHTECPLIEEVKPYLIPITEMTEEQQMEFKKLFPELSDFVFHIEELLEDITFHAVFPYRVFDWFNRNHIDYRNLLGRGAAYTPDDSDWFKM